MGATGATANAAAGGGEAKPPRLDKFLWAIRVFKTRSLAAEALRGGLIKVSGKVAKPASPVRVGDVVSVQRSGLTRTLRILQLIEKRVSAPLAQACYEDETPEEVIAAWRANRENQPAPRDPGSGRPTKKDRREIGKFFE